MIVVAVKWPLMVALGAALSGVGAPASSKTTRKPSETETRQPRLNDLSLTYLPPVGSDAGVVAVLLSGDGGWADLVKSLAEGLANHGVGVVGFNSRSWLSKPRTPDETAAAVALALASIGGRWPPAEKLLIVGYSRGADLAPFVANRLPAPLRSKLAGVAMLGLAPSASFEFHWSDLVKDTPRSTDIPIASELERLRETPMVCVYGSEEKVSGCRDLREGLLRKEMRGGGHHFDGDSNALVQSVMSLISRQGKSG